MEPVNTTSTCQCRTGQQLEPIGNNLVRGKASMTPVVTTTSLTTGSGRSVRDKITTCQLRLSMTFVISHSKMPGEPYSTTGPETAMTMETVKSQPTAGRETVRGAPHGDLTRMLPEK